MLRAVFCDRDGVINVDHGYVGSIEKFEFIKGVKNALATIKAAGFLTVLVTNQSGIARGFYTESDFKKLSFYMQSVLDLYRARFDLILYCPHHPKAKIPKYCCECNCRKPKAGMILNAASKLNIDLAQSIMIGDNFSDIKAGLSAGVGQNILLTNGAKYQNYEGINIPQYIDLSTYVSSSINIFKKK